MASVDDLYQLLEEKENDLHLAAELGKALLERNESLTREYEKHCSDSTQQLEKLKSENMWLRGQLSKHSDEWEEVMKDHNEDIQQLREQLSAKAKAFAAQAQSTQEITQLAQQNQRLSAELDKVLESEELLKLAHSDVKVKHDELKADHQYLKQAHEEVTNKERLCKKKLIEAEQKISALTHQTERLNHLCDELSYKNNALDREKQEMLEQVRLGDRQIEMLKDKNAELFEQIQELATNSSINSPSFLEELEYSQKSLTSGYCSNLSLLDELDSDEAITMMPVDNLSQLRIEVLETYQELQTIVDELETSECATSQPKVKATASKDISNGELISTAKHVKYLVTRRHQLGTLLAQIADLKQEVQSKSSKVESLESDLELSKNTRSSKDSEHVDKLKEDNKEMNDCLAKIKDELSRTKADNRKLERELLETIQKKIKLSQQVEQWQLDMEEMVENQVRCMFLLEQQNKGRPLHVTSSPAAADKPPEIKQKAPFNRTDRRRFSFFGKRSKD